MSGSSARRIDRRQFLRNLGVGAVALGATAAGCSSGPGAVAPPSTTTSPLDDAAWAALGAQLSGQLVLPADPTYDTARLVYNLRFASARPAAIAYCATPVDVQRCVDFARSHGLTPIPRAGGHSYGGYSTGAGLVVDVTPMAKVTLQGPSAVIGGGARLIDVYAAMSAAGVLIPAGSCPSVGLTGLALGGGVGVVSRKYGLTCDSFEALEVVTADGRLLRIDPTSHQDLFWAHQGGGGGNFGIVTSLQLATHAIPPIALFTLDFAWARASEVLGSWLAWMSSAPDELWSNCQLLAEAGNPVVRCTGVYTGDDSALAGLVASLVGAVGASPTYRFVGPEDYLRAMLIEAGCEDIGLAACHLAGPGSTGTLPRSTFAAKSAYVSAMPSDTDLLAAVGSVASLAEEEPSLGGGLVFDSYGGAINRVEPAATAFVHRDCLSGVQLSVSWSPATPPGVVAGATGWLAHAATTIAPMTNAGAYQNYIDPTLSDWQQAYYGANLARLRRVKATYDPDNVFRFAQSIPPSTERSPAPGSVTSTIA